MTKWTSGPWWYSEEDNAVYEKQANVIVVYEKGLQFGKYDGHLIAAAPTMAEALETTKRMLDDTMKWHTVVDADTMTTLGETIDAALAKARGEQ